MKIVIQTCKGYEQPIEKLLASINFHNHASTFIIVVNKCEKEGVHKKLWTCQNGHTAEITTIETPKNLWEYVSFEKVQKYNEHPLIDSEYYFFMHDTCWVTDPARFWNGLQKLRKHCNLSSTPNGICFPGRNSTCHNMMLARKQFVLEYGAQFVGKTFTKEQGIHIEFSDRNINGIKGNKNWPYTTFGRRARRRPSSVVYSNGAKRILIYYPLLDLYKAYIHVDLHNRPGARKHPERP